MGGPQHLELLKKIIWRHNILTEEVEGLTSCTISLHNLTYLPDDIYDTVALTITGALCSSERYMSMLRNHQIMKILSCQG